MHYFVVASKGGDPKAPGWYHNLEGHPDVEINVGTKAIHGDGAPVTPDDSRLSRGCGRSSTRDNQQPVQRLPEADVTADP